MKYFDLTNIVSINAHRDEFYYEMKTSNCTIELKATIDIKYGYVLIDILQKLGYVKKDEMKDVYKAFYKFLDTSFIAEVAIQENLDVFLDPAGDDHYFVQVLNQEGIMYYYKDDRETIFDNTYELMTEMFEEITYGIVVDDDDLDYIETELDPSFFSLNVDVDDDDLPF